MNKYKVRPCLRCSASFNSTTYNRICSPCHKREHVRTAKLNFYHANKDSSSRALCMYERFEVIEDNSEDTYEC